MCKSCIFLIIFLSNLSCREKKPGFILSKNDLITINIQPFEGITADKVAYISKELSKVYPHVTINKVIKLPASAYYPQRNRYRADSIIHYLKSITGKGHVTIGLTDKDISTSKNAVTDWGVMGLGYSPGNACVASLFRLSQKNRNMQLFKVAVHELGHTQGLSHCPIKTCFMRNAEGRNPTNEEKEFCDHCKHVLNRNGWNLN